MTPETQFKTAVKKWLDDEGIYNIPYPAGRFSRVGIPDTLMVINGLFIGCEFKVAKGDYGAKSTYKPTEIQKYHIDTINNHGGCAFVLYPNDFDYFKLLIMSLKDFPNQDTIERLRRL